eukprot:366562-Chlamydomonas_euryale.AAC.5
MCRCAALPPRTAYTPNAAALPCLRATLIPQMLLRCPACSQVTDWFTNWRARHWRRGMQHVMDTLFHEGSPMLAGPLPADSG